MRREIRTEHVLDIATRHSDGTFEVIKTKILTLSWKVISHTNEIWCLQEVSPRADRGQMVSDSVANIESRLGRATKPEGQSGHVKKCCFRVSERTDLEVFAGDRAEDKERFVAWP